MAGLTHPNDPQSYSHEGDQLPDINRGIEVAPIITMGITFIYNRKEGSYGAYHIRFEGAQ
jgi:hypothetical protein